MICDWSSVKSRGPLDTPEYGTCESRLFSAWPASWKSVWTSSRLSSAGWSPEPREKLATLVTIGSTRLPSLTRVPRKPLVHAPTRLPGRGW